MIDLGTIGLLIYAGLNVRASNIYLYDIFADVETP